MKRIAIAALLLPAAAGAQDWASKPNDELCISLAVQMISGQDQGKNTLIQELQSRKEECAPSDMYIKIAQARLQFQQAQAQQVVDDEAKAENFRRRIGQAAQAYLLLQQQNRPVTTTCRHNEIMDTTTCTTP